MKAVKVSLFVGLSAFFRVLFAQQILDMFDVSQCIAFALITLFVYVVDRSFDYNSRESLVFAVAIFVVAVLLSNFVYAPFIALAVGFMYSKGINGFRLKMGYGIKNAVTGLTWGITIALYS